MRMTTPPAPNTRIWTPLASKGKRERGSYWLSERASEAVSRKGRDSNRIFGL